MCVVYSLLLGHEKASYWQRAETPTLAILFRCQVDALIVTTRAPQSLVWLQAGGHRSCAAGRAAAAGGGAALTVKLSSCCVRPRAVSAASCSSSITRRSLTRSQAGGHRAQECHSSGQLSSTLVTTVNTVNTATSRDSSAKAKVCEDC